MKPKTVKFFMILSQTFISNISDEFPLPKNKHQILTTIRAGILWQKLFNQLKEQILPGKHPGELFQLTDLFVKQHKLELDYSQREIGSALSLSRDNILMHCGLAEQSKKIFQTRELIRVDIAFALDGFFIDGARTLYLGPKDCSIYKESRNLQNYILPQIKPGTSFSHYWQILIKNTARLNLHLLPMYGGHGIGKTLHEEPRLIPGTNGFNEQVFSMGQIMAIEFIATLEKGAIFQKPNETCHRSQSRLGAVHEEDTVIITQLGAIPLTENFSHTYIEYLENWLKIKIKE